MSAPGMLHGNPERLRDRGGNIIRPGRLYTPLHIRLRKLGGVLGKQIGPERQDAAGLLTSSHDERRLVAKRREQIAESVAEARRRVEVDKGWPSGCLGIAVRHTDDASLLKAQDVIDVRGPIVQKCKFGRAWITKNPVDPEGAQHVKRCLPDSEIVRVHIFKSLRDLR